MDKINRELSLIAYYLSEYNESAISALGYRTCNEALKGISVRLGKPNNYLKLRRDEFDVLTNSTRRGWANRPPTKEVIALFDEFSQKSFEELTAHIIDILRNADEAYKKEVAEAVEDKEYIEAVNKVTESDSGTKVLRDKPVAAKKAQSRNTHVHVRDPMVATNALCNADYKCEVCAEHETFIRKSNGKPYTEPHHLVPVRYQSQFDVSLDVENNIVSLCSNCHNRIHYGADASELLHKLYDDRKDVLKKAGIKISFSELERLYK